MPKRQRMTRADFSSIAPGASRRYFGALFSLSVSSALNTIENEPKCACVVSKKVAAHAVDRNLIKRRCREACRIAVKGMRSGHSLIFYAKKEAKGASYKDIEGDIKKLLAQIR
jgi:ribonuclease P protein component